MFGGNFAPAGWHFCDGSLQPINEYETLFQLIGTTYGGDGEVTFALPDLRSRLPIHQGTLQGGQTYLIGQIGGVETVTLTTPQLPSHTHPLNGAGVSGDTVNPSGNVPANSFNVTPYVNESPGANMAIAISSFGGSVEHNNVQPFLCISFIISFFGVFPSQT